MVVVGLSGFRIVLDGLDEVIGFFFCVVAAFLLVTNILTAFLLGHGHGHRQWRVHYHKLHHHSHGEISKDQDHQHHARDSATKPLLEGKSDCNTGSKKKSKTKKNINVQGAYLHVLPLLVRDRVGYHNLSLVLVKDPSEILTPDLINKHSRIQSSIQSNQVQAMLIPKFNR